MPEVDAVTPEETQQPGIDPYELLAKFNGPTKTTVEAWKTQACNGMVMIFSPDSKRVFILRGLSAREWDAAQKAIPANTLPENVEQYVQASIIARACLWTNVSADNKLNDDNLRNFSAGLPGALFEIVSRLSDFLPPAAIDRLSALL